MEEGEIRLSTTPVQPSPNPEPHSPAAADIPMDEFLDVPMNGEFKHPTPVPYHSPAATDSSIDESLEEGEIRQSTPVQPYPNSEPHSPAAADVPMDELTSVQLPPRPEPPSLQNLIQPSPNPEPPSPAVADSWMDESLEEGEIRQSTPVHPNPEPHPPAAAEIPMDESLEEGEIERPTPVQPPPQMVQEVVEHTDSPPTAMWSQMAQMAEQYGHTDTPPPSGSPGLLTVSDYLTPSRGSPSRSRLPIGSMPNAGSLSPHPPPSLHTSQPGPSEDRFPPGFSPNILSSIDNQRNPPVTRPPPSLELLPDQFRNTLLEGSGSPQLHPGPSEGRFPSPPGGSVNPDTLPPISTGSQPLPPPRNPAQEVTRPPSPGHLLNEVWDAFMKGKIKRRISGPVL